MRLVFKIILMSLLLSSCARNNDSSTENSSSSFKNYDDISTVIVDTGNYDERNTFVVEGKVETSDGNRVLPFNTQMNLTTYSNNVYNSLTPVYNYHIKRLHILFDRYNEYKDENGNIINNLKIINDSYAKNKEIVIDEDLFKVLEMSIELSKLTEGYFNPTMGALIDGWSSYFSPYGFINEDFTIEKENSIITKKISIVDYQDLEDVIELNKEKLSVKFNRYSKAGTNSVILSLGAIAKGYAIDYFRQKFAKHSIPLIISGSASSTYVKGLNPNPTRDNWTVQINSAYKDDIGLSKPLLISEIPKERVISTSGDYEQLFYYRNNDDLIRRHHILNPYTGHSESYYRNITLYAESRSDILDGLSTALFNIDGTIDNFEKITKIISNVEEYYNINIDYLFQKEVDDQVVDMYLNVGFESTINSYYDYIEVREIVRVDDL